MHQPPKRIGWFARTILGRDLYPYQELIADTILDSVINGYGYAFTCMLSRQSGKNELSAAVEAYLLFAMEQGTLIKAAPTFKPQVITSRLRLLSMLDNDYTRGRVWKSYGPANAIRPLSRSGACPIQNLISLAWKLCIKSGSPA